MLRCTIQRPAREPLRRSVHRVECAVYPCWASKVEPHAQSESAPSSMCPPCCVNLTKRARRPRIVRRCHSCRRVGQSARRRSDGVCHPSKTSPVHSRIQVRLAKFSMHQLCSDAQSRAWCHQRVTTSPGPIGLYNTGTPVPALTDYQPVPGSTRGVTYSMISI